MALTADEERRLRAEIARIRPLLAAADRAEQERLLGEAFARAGLAPRWEEWLAWATRTLPAYQK
jgi:hypothetical protein